jgi:hypothetical protein
MRGSFLSLSLGKKLLILLLVVGAAIAIGSATRNLFVGLSVGAGLLVVVGVFPKSAG